MQTLDREELLDALSDGTVEDTLFDDDALQGIDLDEAIFAACEFRNTDLGNLAATGIEIRDCVFTQASVTNATLRRVDLRRTTFFNCRLTGLSLLEAKLVDITFDGCRFDMGSIRFGSLENVKFEDCVLVDSDFSSAEFKKCKFEKCDLTTAEFSNAKCNDVFVAGCTLDELRGLAGLRGSRMPWDDLVGLAPQFAAALGIGIAKDDD